MYGLDLKATLAMFCMILLGATSSLGAKAEESSVEPVAHPTPAPALVRQELGNWDNARHMPVGTEIRVTMTNDRNLRGTFQSATDDALIVATPTAQESLNRTMILRVSSKGRSRRLRNTLLGLGEGASAGLATGALIDTLCPRNGCLGGDNVGKEVFTPIGAAVGLAVGALWPTGGWHDVYRVK